MSLGDLSFSWKIEQEACGCGAFASFEIGLCGNIGSSLGAVLWRLLSMASARNSEEIKP